MRRLGIPALLGLATALIVAGSAGRGYAQRQWPYRPATPTLSPYMNLYRTQSGPLDNYNTFVRPELELQDTLRQQERLLDRQQIGLHSVTTAVSQFGRFGSMRPTGIGSVFMNYSHYYPAPGFTSLRGGRPAQAFGTSRAAALSRRSPSGGSAPVGGTNPAGGANAAIRSAPVQGSFSPGR